MLWLRVRLDHETLSRRLKGKKQMIWSCLAEVFVLGVSPGRGVDVRDFQDREMNSVLGSGKSEGTFKQTQPFRHRKVKEF